MSGSILSCSNFFGASARSGRVVSPTSWISVISFTWYFAMSQLPASAAHQALPNRTPYSIMTVPRPGWTFHRARSLSTALSLLLIWLLAIKTASAAATIATTMGHPMTNQGRCMMTPPGWPDRHSRTGDHRSQLQLVRAKWLAAAVRSHRRPTSPSPSDPTKLVERFEPLGWQTYHELGTELTACGALPLEWPADILWYGPVGWGGRWRSELLTYSCSRQLLEAGAASSRTPARARQAR